MSFMSDKYKAEGESWQDFGSSAALKLTANFTPPRRSLFAEYISEREQKNIIEDEKGFMTYQIIAPNTCYLEDVFVRPEYRREGHAKVMFRQLEDIARTFNCTEILTSVKPSAFGSTESLKVILTAGFTLSKCVADAIFFTKEI